MRRRLSLAVLAAFALLSLPAGPSGAQPARAVDPALYGGLRWRNIGPFRGGRTDAVSGVPGDARTYYSGAVGGGLWKTTNAGRTWLPVMDAQPVASIGAVAVAPSDPNTVYAGSGEADMRSDIVHGNGMYRSTDAGATWTRIGLDDSRQIGRILVDPANAKMLLAAVLGHAYGPNETRGVYRSADGGATWTRTLFRDRDTGAIDLAADASGKLVFASLWQTRRPPWNAYPPASGPGSGLYKSTDGGATWNPVLGGGFPAAGLGKIGLAVAPSDPRRVYAVVDARDGGLYRSDDGGAQWRRVDADRRLWGRGWYFCHVAVDPKNPDKVYVSDTALYASADGGASFSAVKGSPDGDDFHQLWIDPRDPARMGLASDQGTTISLDGGASWSSWFNQPTGQFYHVATDGAFPYRLYGAQQDSGAAMILSRSDHRGISARDWRPLTAGGESGSIAPDPHDRDLVYGNAYDGSVNREDLRSAQTRRVTPAVADPSALRSEWTMPLAFGPGHALYASYQQVFRTRDGGAHWDAISGDLTRVPPAGEPRRGVVYALAPSPRAANVVWAGTDDGLVRVTRDGGKTWANVTPPGVSAWAHVAGIEASHYDARSAYVAVERHRLDDDRPYLYVTHDGGRTWRAAASGLPDGSFVNAVREDPVRPGLLYAATETGVFVSFDDGAAWRSLRLNMPVVSVRDLAVRDGDLAIATHGRAFWILDDVEPLRQLAAAASPGARLSGASSSGARLFAPRTAVRMRAGHDEAEATPPETPLGENPPNGAYLDYIVPPGAHGPLTLAVADARGTVVRRWSSDDRVPAPDASKLAFPAYWLVQPQPPSSAPGMHRFVWDFATREGDDAPLAPPGRYTVRLTLNGHSYTQPLTVRRDPRVRATDADLVAQYALAHDVDALLVRLRAAIAAATQARAEPGADVTAIDAIAGTPPGTAANAPPSTAARASTLRADADALADLEAAVESADTVPSKDERTTWSRLRSAARTALRAWSALRT